VCPVAETASPKRMESALTYARRYALFTLVGIAGEDDLDAPDLNDGSRSDPELGAEPAADGATGLAAEAGQSRGAASSTFPGPRIANGGKEKFLRPARIQLEPAPSAELRDRLIGELVALRSADEAADWVHNSLPAKNTLTSADALVLEAKFQERLAAIEKVDAERLTGEDIVVAADATAAAVSEAPECLTPTAFPVPSLRRRRRVAAKTIRLRDREHCKFVARQPCVVCGRMPAEAHHIRFAQPRALGRKVSDEFTVPVCRLHHRELHRYGDEASWWAGVGVDPLPIGLALWRQSRKDLSADPIGGALPPNAETVADTPGGDELSIPKLVTAQGTL
jgi:hypothetical protein